MLNLGSQRSDIEKNKLTKDGIKVRIDYIIKQNKRSNSTLWKYLICVYLCIWKVDTNCKNYQIPTNIKLKYRIDGVNKLRF